MEENSMGKLRLYLREYHAVEGYFGIKRTTGLDGAVFRAEDILSQSHGKPSEPQRRVLRGTTDLLERYVETGREFASEHRQELVEIYEELSSLFKDYQGKRDKRFSTTHGYNTVRLNLLKQERVIFPSLIEGIIISLRVLKEKGINGKELNDRALLLKNKYWGIYNRRKAEYQARKSD